jgi:hypothetical protein
LAIKEDLIVEKVEIEANNNVFNRERPFNFTAHVTDEEGETNRCDYELTFAAIY